MGDNYRPVQPLYGRKVPENLSNWAKLIQTASSQTKIHSYKSQVTASGLGAPLVIKHLSQEEPKVAQHDQWYWSMVSTIGNNLAGDIPGHAFMSLNIDPPMNMYPRAILFVWHCALLALLSNIDANLHAMIIKIEYQVTIEKMSSNSPGAWLGSRPPLPCSCS